MIIIIDKQMTEGKMACQALHSSLNFAAPSFSPAMDEPFNWVPATYRKEQAPSPHQQQARSPQTRVKEQAEEEAISSDEAAQACLLDLPLDVRACSLALECAKLVQVLQIILHTGNTQNLLFAVVIKDGCSALSQRRAFFWQVCIEFV
jgi:hypothetical protein